MEEKLVSFDLDTDLVMSLKYLIDALSKIDKGNDTYFKWAIIYAHNSVQSAMCLALVTSGSHLVRKRDSYDKEYGDLDNVEWLYEKLRLECYLPYVGSQVINSDRFEKEKIKRLQAVRNTFIHQQPSLYLFTCNELVELIHISIDLVDFLVNESERFSINVHKQFQIKELVGELKMQLNR